MNRFARTLIPATRALAVLLAVIGINAVVVTDAAAADTDHAVITIVNPTHLALNYTFQWGEGPRESFTLQPGESRWHAWQYDYPGQNRSPIPTITFDTDLSGGVLWDTFRLAAYAAMTRGIETGKQYFLEIRGRFLTIVEASF